MAINYNTNVPSVWIVYGFRNHLSVISCDRRHCPWSRLLQGPLEKSQSKYNSQYKGDTQMRAVHQFSQKVEMYFLNTQEKIPLGKTTFPLGLFIMFTDLRINVNPEQKKETILNIRFTGSAWISQDHESVGIRCPYSHTAVLQVLILHLLHLSLPWAQILSSFFLISTSLYQLFRAHWCQKERFVFVKKRFKKRNKDKNGGKSLC